MDETKYQVFVSSTYVDLIEARKKVIETVLSLYHFPVGMEMFSADDSEQWEIIKETIDASDYYVIVIGHKYGSLSESGISYTEREYDYAKSLGIPVLAFIRNRDLPTLPNEREIVPESSKKLDNFIQKAQANKMCDFWDQIDDLATKVAIALPKIMRRNPRVGWVRGDRAVSSDVSSELAELSTENRKLRERLRDYESRLLSDFPVLELCLIDADLKLNIASDYKRESYYPPLSREDIPTDLNEVISDDDIGKYNNKLPSNKFIDAHNRKVFLHECYKNQSINITPLLKNIGRRVASDIHISMEIPKFIIAYNDSNKNVFNKMPEINVPTSPVVVERAKERARKSFAGMKTGWISEMGIYDKIIPPEIPNILRGNTLPNIRPLNASEWVDYEKGRIVLRARKLIQSLSIEFEKIILIPIAEGEGIINIKIVCEEMREPIIFSRNVTVTSLI